jgi:glycosyltransferase involved in cell wall biosynthesis
LVVNEAMQQGTPVIASDAVGAAAGGLVRHGRNGLIAPAGDPAELAARIAELAHDAALRERLSQAAREDVQAYTEAAWAEGMSRALAAVGAGARC